MLLSHTCASSSPSQISRLYPILIVFFQVSHHPGGVGEGREESSSYMITDGCGRGWSHHFPPVSQPQALLLSCCSCAAPFWVVSAAGLFKLRLVGGSQWCPDWGGDSSLPSKSRSFGPWLLAAPGCVALPREEATETNLGAQVWPLWRLLPRRGILNSSKWPKSAQPESLGWAVAAAAVPPGGPGPHFHMCPHTRLHTHSRTHALTHTQLEV